VRSALIRLHGTVPPRVSLLASVSLATFLVALLAATQFRSQPLPPSNRFARNQALTQSVNELEAQNRRLKSQVQSLQASVKTLEDDSAQRSSSAQQANALLDTQKTVVALGSPSRSTTETTQTTRPTIPWVGWSITRTCRTS